MTSRGERTGRRPGPSRTREDIIAAARDEFAERGYDGATIRGIARRARVDPALVHHYFGTKQGVFAAAMDLPLNPADVLPEVVGAGTRGLGERIVRTFLGVWEPPASRASALALIRSAVTNERAAATLRGFVRDAILSPVARALEVPDADLRATLAASQLIGLAFLRYVVRVEPLASADPEALVAAIAPRVQGYLTGSVHLQHRGLLAAGGPGIRIARPADDRRSAKVLKDDEIGLLSNVPLFSECSRKELEAIARATKEVTHGEGNVIAKEGEPGVGFFMIVDGTARVDVGGSARSTLGPGDFFGEISLLDEGPRTASVTAETPMKLLALPAWTFKGLIEEHPTMAAKLLKVVAQRLRAASQEVTH